MSLEDIYCSIEESELYQCHDDNGSKRYLAAKSEEQAAKLFKLNKGIENPVDVKLYEDNDPSGENFCIGVGL